MRDGVDIVEMVFGAFSELFEEFGVVFLFLVLEEAVAEA